MCSAFGGKVIKGGRTERGKKDKNFDFKKNKTLNTLKKKPKSNKIFRHHSST